ncbi:MAG: hypothetical protein AAF363_03530 [Bacteroidota bacterium]
MKNYVVVLLLALSVWSCEVKDPMLKPEPHLELGQLTTFLGCDPDRSYIIIGYRNQLESSTEKEFRGQEYIVFLYINDAHDIKQGVIHKNSVIKR